MIGTDPKECQIHLVPLSNITLDNLEEYLATMHPHFNRILAFRPTGWTFSGPSAANSLPDVNFIIQRDQARGFSDVSLKPIRGSCRKYMMFGRFSLSSAYLTSRCAVLRTLFLLRVDVFCT